MDDTGTILVVDDERDFLDTLYANLELEGYRVLSADNGVDAVKLAAESEDLRLVLLDIRMTGIDGVEALARIRRHRPDLPVILMTAYALRDLEERAFELGAYTIVQKPFEMGAMLELIARAMSTPALLVVDPTRAIHERARDILRSAGHRVVTVESADEALAAFDSHSFDVAILANGSQNDLIPMLRRIRAAGPSLSIVILTSNPSAKLLSEAGALGISGWLDDLTPRSLLRTLAEVRARKA